MARRPTSSERNSQRLTIGTRVNDLNRLEGLSAADRNRLNTIMDEVGGIDGLDAEDILVVTRPPLAVDAPELSTSAVAQALAEATEQIREVQGPRLTNVMDRVAEVLRRTEPDAVPNIAINIGERGLTIPLASRTLERLLQLAASDDGEGEESVIWDDGINQLVVHLGRLKTAVTEGRVRVDIPVEADGVRATMSVPFAVGSKETVAGTVMATTDRPAGNALIARIWGDALIALAHQSIVSAAESTAAAAGSDTSNRRLVPGTLTATRGRLTVESISAPSILNFDAER